MSKKKLTGAAARRRNLPISLNSAAQEALKNAKEQSGGIPMTEILERVLRWFVAQDDVVRGAILGTLPQSISADAARITLEKLASQK